MYGMEVNRKNVCLIWTLTGAVCSVAFSIVSMLYWQLTYVNELNIQWQPVDDFWGMLLIMPFGWVFSIIYPTGWLSIIGLVWSLYKVTFKPLIISVLGSILFGIFWPKFFVELMGI